LPQLHAALLTLGGHDAPPEAIDALTSAHRGISDLLREMPASISPTAKRGVLGALRYEVEGELAGKFDEVVWHVEPNAEAALDRLPSLIGESVYFAAREAVRNAAKYGRGSEVERPLKLSIIARRREQLEVEIADDGTGMTANTQAPQGTGHGLALHGTLLAVAGGQLSVENDVNGGTKVALRLPVTEV
jgi:signal transduction histidine kinase